ncbi:hypothetical protein pdam_00013635, partial [Pocillopora damicornis]
MYLLTAVKPIVTGETYTANRLKKAFIWQSTLPKGHLPEISTPAANGMTKMALNRSLIANAMILVFLYTAIHTMMLPARDIIFSAIIKLDSTMVKATLRDVDETNVCPKLASNGLVSNETSWAAGGAFDSPVMLNMTNFLPS